MDKQKKQELAEVDGRWGFEKKVKTYAGYNWEEVLQCFNDLQEQHGDLYMKVSKLPIPGRLSRMRLYYKQKRDVMNTDPLTFHHKQVYDWFYCLAYRLDKSLGETVHLVMSDIQTVRDELDLGDTVNVQISSVEALETGEKSKVSRDELKGMIQDD